MRRIFVLSRCSRPPRCCRLAPPACLRRPVEVGSRTTRPVAKQQATARVADVQCGFHHDSISHAFATVEQIGRKAGAYMTMIRTDSQLITNGQIVGKVGTRAQRERRVLTIYDAIFMLPSGFGTMTEQQKRDLLAFVHDQGKGLIVGHATGVAFTNWPEFGEMVGGYMDGEFNANAQGHRRGPGVPGRERFGARAVHVQRPASRP